MKMHHAGINYYVDSCFSEKLSGSGFDEMYKELISLDAPEEDRAVFLSKKLNVVIKNNILSKFRRRLYAQFGLQNYFGKYSLSDEYKNLLALSHIDFVPNVYAFGMCDSFPVKKECLVIEYYEDSLTADEMINMYPEKKDFIVKSVFQLFLKAWNSGFAHMDPHLKNILFLRCGSLRFIDFECCCLNPKDKEFYMGFSTGYFFYFWFHKYMSEEEYSKYVKEFVGENCPGLNTITFDLYYNKFRCNKISRSVRYKCFGSAREREKLIY